MKLEQDLVLTVTRLEDATDNDGYLFLKAKAYNGYKAITKNGKRKSYNMFTSVRLYPVNEEQYEQTKERLFSQEVNKPKLKIIAYESEIFTNLIAGQIRPILIVRKFDFFNNKLFRRVKLLNYGKGEQE